MIVTRKALIDIDPTPARWAEVRALTKRALAEMTPEEDAAITADAMSDPDSLPMTDEEFAAARRIPLSEALPSWKPVLPLEADLAESLMAAGPGWERRANDILRAALERA